MMMRYGTKMRMEKVIKRKKIKKIIETIGNRRKENIRNG